MAGLHVAGRLSGHHDVRVFEKSRRPGGRMATRISDGFEFDHGAQFFTARSNGFRNFLAPLVQAEIVAAWRARFVEFRGSRVSAARRWDDDYPHYVPVPAMNQLGAYLAKDLNIEFGSAVRGLRESASGWNVELDSGQISGPFDWVVATAPAAQTAALLPADAGLLPPRAASQMLGCFALMLGFDAPMETDFDAALVKEADISWISINSSKPGRRRDPLTWLIHSTNKWAEAHMEDDLSEVTEHLLAETGRITGVNTASAPHIRIHRWRYANLPKQNQQAFAIDHDRAIAACGDWFIRGRVEAAFLSADALANEMLGNLRPSIP